jgi:hypothetical protein
VQCSTVQQLRQEQKCGVNQQPPPQPPMSLTHCFSHSTSIHSTPYAPSAHHIRACISNSHPQHRSLQSAFYEVHVYINTYIHTYIHAQIPHDNAPLLSNSEASQGKALSKPSIDDTAAHARSRSLSRSGRRGTEVHAYMPSYPRGARMGRARSGAVVAMDCCIGLGVTLAAAPCCGVCEWRGRRQEYEGASV